MLFSNKTLIKMILPLFALQVLAVTIGMVDTMMVASAGDAAVSGVSLVNSLDQMLVIVFSSLTSGGVVVVSQLLGSKNIQGAQNGAKQVLYSATAVAAALTVVVQILRKPLLTALFGTVEADVMESANEYFFFVSLSFPLLAIQSSCEAVQRVEGKTGTAMIVLSCANLLNVAGNYILIKIAGLGAAGAAISTLISRAASAVTMLIVVSRKRNTLQVHHFLHYKPDFGIIRKILRIGIPNGIENGMFYFGRLLTQTLVSTTGTAMIAANAAANSLANYQYMAGTAISGVMIPVVGRCIGAHETEQARIYGRKLTWWTYFCLWGVALGTALLSGPLLGVYDLDAGATEVAKQLIFWHLLCEIVLWPAAFTLPNSFRAAGDVKYTMVISMVSMWVFRVVLAYFLVQPVVSIFGLFTVPGFNMGILGVWVAMTIDWVFRASLFVIHFARGKWLRKKSLVS